MGKMMEGHKHPNLFPPTWDQAKWQNQHYDNDFLWQKCTVQGLAFVRQLKGPDGDWGELLRELITLPLSSGHVLKVKSLWNW